jgi:tripartite-type tricarboxylate transporter receptor subunit TctC
MIVPVPPGSSPDVAARVFAERLGARWGKTVVVENRPGADGLIGTAAFVAAQDDHALLFSFGTIAVPASLPVATLPELVKYARTRPGQLNWATGGGAFPILMAGFVKSAALEMAQVPYSNQNLAIQDLAEGRIQVFATAMTPVLPLVQAGKVPDHEVAKRLGAAGQIVRVSTPAEFAAAIEQQRLSIEKTLRLIGKAPQ